MSDIGSQREMSDDWSVQSIVLSFSHAVVNFIELVKLSIVNYVSSQIRYVSSQLDFLNPSNSDFEDDLFDYEATDLDVLMDDFFGNTQDISTFLTTKERLALTQKVIDIVKADAPVIDLVKVVGNLDGQGQDQGHGDGQGQDQVRGDGHGQDQGRKDGHGGHGDGQDQGNGKIEKVAGGQVFQDLDDLKDALVTYRIYEACVSNKETVFEFISRYKVCVPAYGNLYDEIASCEMSKLFS